MDTSHLIALSEGLAHERQRLSTAKTPQERELRTVWVAQREREVADEMRRLGMSTTVDEEMSADDLARELMA